MMRRLVALVGPTASGKSAIAVELARRLGGEVVNADSRQVYRGMNIGTAKPTPAERGGVRHHLYDIAGPSDPFSLAVYRGAAKQALDDIWARGSFAWLVGGTGQYVWALLEDWQVPQVEPNIAFRKSLEEEAGRAGAEALHQRLEAADPVAAQRIDPRNLRRVIRALEVFEATGRPISEWQTRGKPDFEYLLFGLDVARNELYPRIDRRVAAMFATGFVEEVKALLESGVPADAPAMSSIGYRQVAGHLAGRCTLEEAIDGTRRATRQLARRQMQWFRRDDPRITWVRDADDIDLQANIFTGACVNVIRGEGPRR